MAGKLGLGHLETLLEGLNSRTVDFTDTTIANLAAVDIAGTLTVDGATTQTGALAAATRDTGDIAVSATTYGAGAIGTGDIGAPELRRFTENGVIVTQIKVDLTGLAAKGGAANDAIGLAAGGAAFIYRNVVADNGIIFKVELACIELPAEASGTLTDDINLTWNTSGTIAYDAGVGTGSQLDAGAMVAGQVVEQLAPAITANHYLYLTEGSTEASDCVFNAGQYVITLYGHALLT